MNQKSYAFIPARNGSKRIPQKNFLSFNGQNTLRTVCETALSSGIFAKVIVSTDNPILCSNILKDLAYIEIHNRKLELSTDESTVDDVAYDYFSTQTLKMEYNICCIYPTNILLKASSLIESYEIFLKNRSSGLMGVSKYKYKIHKAFKMNQNGILDPLFPDLMIKKTQNLEDFVVSNGTFYWTTNTNLAHHKSLLTPMQRGFLVDELQVCDLDELDDLKELKWKIQVN